jgi:Domain of unknown function (DUF4123)
MALCLPFANTGIALLNTQPFAMKNTDEFVSAVRPTATVDALSAERQRYLLVDHAGAPGLMQELRGRPSLTWASLFEDSREVRALEVAPILVQLPEDRSTLGERDFLAWVYRTCRFSTSVTVLHSAWSRGRLARALKARLDVMLPDKMAVMLRYFDTRTLEPFLRALTPQQQGDFLGIAARWQWLDRAGDLHERTTEQLTTDAWPHRFEIDVVQQNTLIEAGEADALAAQMKGQAPDLCQGAPTAQLHALAVQCLPKLGKLGIEDVRTQTLYCLTALQLGPKFDLQPEWAAVLGRVAAKEVTFEDALKEMQV